MNELIQRADLIRLGQGSLSVRSFVFITRHQHQFAMRSVDSPLERGLAEPGFDVFEFRVGPARMVTDDVETENAKHLEGRHASGRKFEQGLDQVADGGLTETLEAGGTELKGRLTGPQYAGQQRRMDFGRRRKDQDVALAKARHRRIGEGGEDLIADHLGFAPSAMAAMQREGSIGSAQGNRRCVESVDPGMDTSQQRRVGRATTRREKFFLIGLDIVDDLVLLQSVILTAGTKQAERGAVFGLVFGVVPFPGLIGLQVAEESLGRLEHEEIDLEHIAEGREDLQVRARDIPSGE